MKRWERLAALVIFIVPLTWVPVAADDTKWEQVTDDGWCNERWEARYCEVRETTLKAPRDVVDVDAGDNGSIRVLGWEEQVIRLRVRIQVWGTDDDEAEELASHIEIDTDETIRATGPRGLWARDSGWSVSFELMVPTESNLSLETSNGSISIRGVRGEIRFDAANGGINLDGVEGDVRGSTTNGSIEIDFAGDRWSGEGLDARTTNGSVKLRFPENYSAQLYTGTTNGRIRLDSPMRFEGTIGTKLRTVLGDGGAEIKVMTTNGSVRIKQG